MSLIVALCSLYLPNVIEFYISVQLLQAKT